MLSSFLRFVSYSQFNLWDVKRYTYSDSLNFEYVVKLSDILIPLKNGVSKKEMIDNRWRIISKINFGGELFLRDFEEVLTYKGNLFLVPSNAIIYSKINARHGCIYYNGKEDSPFCVSSEYPVFTFDENSIDGRFLQKLLRTNTFKKLLNTKTSGISKARIKQNEFLETEIPLPSLEEQQKIVNAYFDKIKYIKTKEDDILEKQIHIKKYWEEILGVKNKKNERLKEGLNFISYSNLTKWSLNQIMRGNKLIFSNSKYGTDKIKNLLIFFEGGKTPSKSQNNYWNGNIYWTSPKDFTDKMFLDSSIDTISALAIKEASLKIYPQNTLLSVFRSGILRHSFPTVLTKVETSINQDVKAYMFDSDRIENLYYLYFIDSFQSYVIENASKKSVTVESINTEEFLELEIPIPPLEKQSEIISFLQNKYDEIKKLENSIETLRQQAEHEFEHAIFYKL